MDDQWIYPSDDAGPADRLHALQEAQDSLWLKLRSEEDPERRMVMLSRFRENRDAIAELTDTVAAGVSPDEVASNTPHYRVELVDEYSVDDAEPDHPEPDHPDTVDHDDGGGRLAPVLPLAFDEAGDLVASRDQEPPVTDERALDLDRGDDQLTAHADEVDVRADDLSDDHRVDEVRAAADEDPGLIAGGPPAFLDSPRREAFIDVEHIEPGPDGFRQPGDLGVAMFGQGSIDLSDEGDPTEIRPGDNGYDRPAALGAGTDVDGDHPPLGGRPFGRLGPDPARFDDESADGRADSSAAATSSADDEAGIDVGHDRVGRPPSGPVGAIDSRTEYPEPANSDPVVVAAHRSSAGPAPTSQFPAVRGPRRPPGPRPLPSPPAASSDRSAGPESPRRALLLLGGLVAVLGLSWVALSRSSDDTPTNVASEQTEGTEAAAPAGPSTDAAIEEIRAGLRNLGLDGVGAERRGPVIFLTGAVPTEAERQLAIGVAQELAVDESIDASELQMLGEPEPGPTAGAPAGRVDTFRTEISRVTASTPLIFDSGQTGITDLHARILNSVASIMKAYPEFGVTVVGFTDDTGSVEGNRQISLARAESVKAYLVSQGVPEGQLTTEPRGEDTSSGSDALANLERRVEFEVDGAGAEVAAGAAPPLRIAVVAPSARNDLAFTQSMVDAVAAVAAERGSVEISITDNTFVPEEAGAAIRAYAEEGYDLVIAHGSQYGTPLFEIAPEYPEVAFAWGTASDTFGLDNVYAYDAAAEQGGYVLGAMAISLSTSGVIGVVGPIEVGDAERYVNGFRAGAIGVKPDATVLVSYTGSFSDLSLAAETARAHAAAGADVMTGSAQMVVGAVSVANEEGALWFGTQSNQSALSPSLVVASQVYHWEVILQQIVADLDGGRLGGRTYTADLANGGLVIEYNPGYAVPDEVKQVADQAISAIANGSLAVPG